MELVLPGPHCLFQAETQTHRPFPPGCFSELFSKPKLDSSSTCLDQGEMLNLSCSIPGAPLANFTIQREDVIVAQDQNFTKIASEWDSGVYTCTASIGKVVKKSNTVQITVCGEWVPVRGGGREQMSRCRV